MPPTAAGAAATQAAYYIISSMSRASADRLHGVLFNKGMCLLNYRLKQRKIDIRLPHCWYKHGDIVVEYWMPPNVQWPKPNEEQTYVYWHGPAPKALSDAQLQKEIIAAAERLRDEFPEDENGINRIVTEVYKFAPFEFQRLFKDVFLLLRLWYNPGTSVQAFVSDRFRPRFTQLKESFPAGDFPDLVLDMEKYAFVVGTLLEKPEGVRFLIDGLSEDCWLHFCKSLRLHPSGHENVRDQTLEIWRREKDASVEVFEVKLKYWVERAARESGVTEFDKPSVKDWLFPSSWGPLSKDSSLAIDETVYS